MVPRKTDQRKTVKTKKTKFNWWWLVLLFVLVCGIAIGVWYLWTLHNRGEKIVEENIVEEPVKVVEPVEPEEVLPKKIDFQPMVDEWVNSISGNRSVMVYDLDRDELVAKYNESEIYNTASLYKLFVVYEGYRKVQSGEWDANGAAGTTGHTISECLDLAIRESYSPCAETLWGYIGRDNLNEIIKKDFGISEASNISNLLSNAQDITKMMKIFYEHKEIIDANLVGQMKDSFLNQPPTTYNWRQGLPSGFTKANVYDKVGWDFNPSGYWNIYHDAAIVEFPENNRHFIVVVMTNRVPFEQIRKFGTNFETTYYNNQ